MTEGLGNRSSDTITFSGSLLSQVFDVIAATITVLIRDRLKRSEEITTAGLRYLGDKPTGTPKSVHQTSPRVTTPSCPSRSWNEPSPMIQESSFPCEFGGQFVQSLRDRVRADVLEVLGQSPGVELGADHAKLLGRLLGTLVEVIRRDTAVFLLEV